LCLLAKSVSKPNLIGQGIQAFSNPYPFLRELGKWCHWVLLKVFLYPKI
jgi:hypothetical protein